MTEAFLHYIWQLQYFRKDELKTSSGEVIQVLHPGTYNTDSGPDFSNARIKIGELEWRGSVEIHIKASGWHDHKHTADDAYEKVVLHVVWENDRPINRTDNTAMPTLELKNRVAGVLWDRYRKLYTSAESIPCASHWKRVPDMNKFAMLDRALMHRLELKAKDVKELLARNNNDWEQTCYQLLVKNFGFKVNADPMLRLSQILPHKLLLRHFDKPVQVEALLFGVSGFLEDSETDEYTDVLKREYDVLRKKYSLEARQMNLSQWKFLRLRPANFPTIRIAQLASLLTKEKNLFSKILEIGSYQPLYTLLHAGQSEYWHTHYRFGKASKTKLPSLGKASIQNMIVNSITPLLTAYGKIHDEQEYVDLAVRLLQNIPAENNKIIRQWGDLEQKVSTAFDSQALIELYNHFCMKRRCLECNVGSYLVKS